MLFLEKKPYWICPNGEQLTSKAFAEEVKSLILKGSDVYIGTDSMLRGDNCIFATVVAFHNNSSRTAKFFYKKFKTTNKEYRNLKSKINEEVNLSVQAAQKIHEFSPETPIELHVDIGKNKENKSRVMMSAVTGWVTGMGYNLKIKPDSWASSSIADNYTK